MCHAFSKFLERLPGGTTNLGKSELDTPDFTLVAKTIFSDSLQFRITRRNMLGPFDISRDELLLSGQDERTDERIRRLRSVSYTFQSCSELDLRLRGTL